MPYEGLSTLGNPCGFAASQPVPGSQFNFSVFQWDNIINSFMCGFGTLLQEIGKALSQYATVIGDVFAGIGIASFLITYADRLSFVRNLLSGLL